MLRCFRPIHPSSLQRAIYVACMLLVFSYILFDVLDLDGSNLPRLLTLVTRAVIVGETVAVIDLQDSRKPAAPSRNIELLFTDLFEKCSRLRRQTTASGLDSARSHGHRVGLPRDSVA